MDSIRMPITVAARKGISAVSAIADEQRVILTSHGREVAVVDSAARIDADMVRLREAALAVVDSAAELVAGRSATHSLAAVCERLGIDADAVQARAAQHIADAR